MEERDTFKSFAKNSMQAALPLPFTGGAARESFRASPTTPVTAFLLARGCTLTTKLTLSPDSCKGIKGSFSTRRLFQPAKEIQ